MQLSDRNLHALIDIKKELLSREVVEEVQAAPEQRLEKPAPPATFRQRHARGSSSFQRGCQRHAFWSPVH